MEFIKKNIILVVVIAISLIASAVLAVLAVNKISEMDTAKNSVDGLKKKAERLNRIKLHPVQGNIDLIEKDISLLNEKIDKVAKVYGFPYASNLEQLAHDLGITYDELNNAFKKSYNSTKSKMKPVDSLNAFFANYDTAKVDAFKAKFKESVIKRTAEKEIIEGQLLLKDEKPVLLDNSINQIILEGFGVQRSLANTVCSGYLKKVKTNLAILLEENEIQFSEQVAEFAFPEYTDSNLPKPSESGMIAVQCGIIEDLIFRLKDAKVKNIEEFEKNALNPEPVNNFQTLKYKLKIGGSLASVRKFINSLINAYETNRIYIVKSMSLSKNIKNVEGLVAKKEELTKLDESFKSNMPALLEGQTRTEYQVITALPNFGKMIIGDDSVSLTLNIEYIRYTGFDLK